MSTLFVQLHGLLTAAHHAAATPALVGQGRVVVDVNEAAFQGGLRVGMSVRQSKSLLPGVEAYDYSAALCDELRAQWLDVATLYTDEIETPAPHEAYLGMQHHPRPEEVARLFLDHLERRFAYHYRAGLCPTKWVARALAKFPMREMPIAGLALAHEPVQVLAPLESSERERLALLGYKKVRHVQELSMATLKGQFGIHALRIHNAAQGGLHEPLVPNYPSPSLAQSQGFFGGCMDVLALHEALGELARGLFVNLCTEGLCTKEAQLRVFLESGMRSSQVTYGKPFRGAHGLHLALVRLLDGLELEEPVEKMTVVLPNLAVAPTKQRAFAGLPGGDTHDAEDALEALRHKFGSYSVHLATEHQEPRRTHVLRAWSHATGWQ